MVLYKQIIKHNTPQVNLKYSVLCHTRRYDMIDEVFFRDRLRSLRNEKQVSAREMSLALGQNESYINKIESGKATTTISSFLNICEYLKISPSVFFDEEIKNTYESKAFEQYIKKLSPNQVKYILELLKDLTKK